MSEVFLNGRFVGDIDDSKEFIQRLVQDRRSGALSNEVNVYYDDALDQVCVESSRGRCRRPLIVVKDGMPALTDRHVKQLQKGEISWSDLVAQGVIEFLDTAEEENSLVAFSDQ